MAAEVKKMYGVDVKTYAVDADIVSDIVRVINDCKPELVLNVALPYQDLAIMDACLERGKLPRHRQL
ncbi:MAG: saccharopine dehydrogenase NADP-binding domain-containing protein [Geovibrio sp.]|nr:saccharopine dehydrogenase NADP-binding domain-containing protein [Geovibrio sp.]